MSTKYEDLCYVNPENPTAGGSLRFSVTNVDLSDEKLAYPCLKIEILNPGIMIFNPGRFVDVITDIQKSLGLNNEQPAEK